MRLSYFILLLDFQYHCFFSACSDWFCWHLTYVYRYYVFFFQYSLFFFKFSYFRRLDIFNVLSWGQELVSRTDCVSASSNGILFTCSQYGWTALLNRHPIKDITRFLSFCLHCLPGRKHIYLRTYIPIIKRILFSVIYFKMAVSLSVFAKFLFFNISSISLSIRVACIFFTKFW